MLDGSGVDQSFILVRSGNSIYTKFFGSEVLLNEQAMILAEPLNQTVVYQPLKPGEFERQLRKRKLELVDTSMLAATNYSVSYLGESSGLKTYELTYVSGAISKAWLSFRSSDSFLTKVEYSTAPAVSGGRASKVIISYSSSALSATDAMLLNRSRILTGSGGAVELAPAYSGHHLIVASNE